jgi:hypothetical protein
VAWAGVVLSASVVVIVLAGVYVIALADMKLERHTGRRHKKKGRHEFEPPEPTEGR